MYNRINKDYTKANLDRDYITKSEAKRFLHCPEIRYFRNLRTLIDNGIIRITKKGAPGYSCILSMDDFKAEMLRRECACWKDYALYRKEIYCKPKHLKQRREFQKNNITEVRLIIKGKSLRLGWFRKDLLPHLKRIVNEIYENIHLFEGECDPLGLFVFGKKIHRNNIKTFNTVEMLKKWCH